MWNLFGSKPACPVDSNQQQWIDHRFRWLEDQFGADTPGAVDVILPTPEFFPERFNGTQDDAQVMLNRIAQYMDVEPARFKLFVYSERQAPRVPGGGFQSTRGSAGVYIRPPDSSDVPDSTASIGIETRQLANPMGLVATLAHEIAHELLLGEQRISAEEPDHEPLTDLLTVFLGLGIFGANATIQDRGWSDGVWVGWSTSRTGYLDQRMFGYALARFAHSRGESNPTWIKHVRADVRTALKQGLHYLANNDAKR